MIHVVRTAYLWDDAAHRRIALANHGEKAILLALSLSFASDFADLFEVCGRRRARRGSATGGRSNKSDVTYAYTGVDGAVRQTEPHLDPAPSQLLASAAVYQTQARAAGRAKHFLVSLSSRDRNSPANHLLPRIHGGQSRASRDLEKRLALCKLRTASSTKRSVARWPTFAC